MGWATLDVADAEAIKTFAAKVVIDHPALNVVIHNAGIMVAEEITAGAMDVGVPEATVATNRDMRRTPGRCRSTPSSWRRWT